MLDTHNVKVGDKVREIATGKVYTVSQIAPAGWAGTAFSAGPRITVSLGPGRYSFEIQHGALKAPAAFELADIGAALNERLDLLGAAFSSLKFPVGDPAAFELADDDNR